MHILPSAGNDFHPTRSRGKQFAGMNRQAIRVVETEDSVVVYLIVYYRMHRGKHEENLECTPYPAPFADALAL